MFLIADGILSLQGKLDNDGWRAYFYLDYSLTSISIVSVFRMIPFLTEEKQILDYTIT